ncbi:5-methylaminomethyl-2-thiouridylate-methyltransferase [Exidia glandulosa HHB12029]|uniref:tRNA-5-taurinomethyluridine 2-sulfurtransferase n=1 Tax=Exidia glandulosa HHB12029 TaxID=1314781 RepID=A0A165DWI2_EXIGL|nr:5-methylaminomethyl-2-thiouridylate-methyltransferase [Exidia glandulosa HHB12029]
MSGGVDSSVTAALLAEQDFDLSAVFMRNWDTKDELGADGKCEWEKDWHDVQQVCKLLDIPCRMVDLSREYWLRVFEPALRVWERGMTPNPDVDCNREIKFDALVQRLGESAQWIATGHYAHLQWDDATHRAMLCRSVDRHKDQSYFLAAVQEPQLRRFMFPISHMTKPQLRELAHARGLPTASREDSVGICFVGQKRRFEQFISEYIPPSPGKIVDEHGKVIGEHNGLWKFTIGESSRVSGLKTRFYVAKKDAERNEIVAVPGRDHPMLQCRAVNTIDWRWVWPDHDVQQVLALQTKLGGRFTTKIRHAMAEIECTPSQGTSPENVVLSFAHPDAGVAPGQTAALYLNEWCLGCGTITETTCTADLQESASSEPT